MDIAVKLEPIDIERDIKQESELIIQNDWLPTKFAENEYYQEFVVVKNESVCDQLTIENLEENEDYDGDYGEDEYTECERDDISVENNSDKEDDSYLEQLEIQDDVYKEDPSGSKVLYQLELKKWIADNYIYRECPVCKEKFTNYDLWHRHILNYKELIEESESNYYFTNDSCGVCRKCNQEFVGKFSRYVHSASHSKDDGKLNILHTICKICHFNSKLFFVRRHVLEKHPEVLKDFKASGSMRNQKCPICTSTYVKHIELCYHFMDKHPHEYKTKLRYNCHLCKHGFFSEEHFLQHLIKKHKLNSWIILNYGKVFEDKDYFACTKCNRLFFQNDPCKLLRHFLNHDSKFRWLCKFCCKKFHFKSLPVSHMCSKMLRFYEEHRDEVIVEKADKIPEKTEWKINSLEEFEEHIVHVCPFCNKEFGKMIKWQHHLRKDHEIDTLKGLEMKIIANDKNKLSCTICYTVVANFPQQLHAHRFQHLPYKPYKCLFCSKALNTFEMAAYHVFKRCKDEDVLVNKIDDPLHHIRSNIEIQCSYCNCKNFHDAKSVSKHYEDEHNSFEEFFIQRSNNQMTCKVCQKHYEKNSCFEHLHNHFDEKAFKCKLCLLSYPTYQSVYKHLASFHNAKPLNKQSNDKTADKTSLLLNKEDKISNVIKLNKSSIKTHVLNEFAEFISYACPECNEGMTSQQKWHTHIDTQHNFFDQSNVYFKDADGSLKCPTCNIVIDSITHVQRHKLTHMPYRSYICNLCYARFNSLGVLYGHFRRKHFAKGAFKCPLCREVLQTEHGRTMHLKEMHAQNEWPDNMCLICYKVLANKCTVNKHMATHDADRFRYTCDVCGAKIILLRDFSAHMDRHKMRGDIKEKIEDENVLKIAHKNSESKDSDDFEIVPEYESENINKRKSSGKFSKLKKKE